MRGTDQGVTSRHRWWTFVAFVAFAAWSGTGLAAEPEPVAIQKAESPSASVAQSMQAEPADLVIGNRKIFTARATNEFGTTPALRTTGVEGRMQPLLDRGGPLKVTTAERDGYIAIVVDGVLIFRVLPGDVDPEGSQTQRQVADAAVRNLELALRDLRESRDSKALVAAAGKAALATLLLAAALWLLIKGFSWLAARVRGAIRKRSAAFERTLGGHAVGRTDFAELAVVPVKLLGWAVALFLLAEWTALVLGFFPYTRPWGEQLFHNIVVALGGFGSAVLRAIPGLLFVALIFAVTRFIVRLVRSFFDAVHAGRVNVTWLDETTARPTGRLLTVAIWLFAFVAAYPYIPGSDSEAFKGIGVFVGLMMSIGSSGVVNQAVSGLMLMYTKTLRPGEFVQIADTEGTVTSIGFLTTRIETLRNVEVAIPNAIIAGNVTRNFSRLAANGGVRLLTSVTIGYDTPWRQVAAMLKIAALRTSRVVQDPPPRVLQTALQDFYVEYTLVVAVAEPRLKLAVLDELHGHIQDVFNEFGVQIMSPNYEADPAAPKVVPREQWHAAPAEPNSTDAPAASRSRVPAGTAE